MLSASSSTIYYLKDEMVPDQRTSQKDSLGVIRMKFKELRKGIRSTEINCTRPPWIDIFVIPPRHAALHSQLVAPPDSDSRQTVLTY